jgi:C-terminal processing protease CtpA/Prc
MRLTLLAAFAIASLTAPAFAQAPLTNGDFEAGTSGAPPPGWRVSPVPGINAKTVTDDVAQGRQAVELSTPAPGGNLTQTIDATPYRGRLVLLDVRTHGDAGGILGLRAGYTTEQALLFTGMATASPAWKTARLLLHVPADAQTLTILAGHQGTGNIWLDDVTLRQVTAAELGFEAPRALTARGLANLTAFTRLLGYVRFFHPSDQAAAADWNSFAIAGVQKVEGASNAQQLATILRALFGPLAPTLQVAAGRAQQAQVPACARCERIGWVHRGIGLDPASPVYKSERQVRAGAEAPFLARLGGGVSASIPLTLPRDAGGTLPHVPQPQPDSGKPALFSPHGDDRSTRLADVALAWTVFQHFYPYFDVVKTDWDAELTQALTRAATDTDAEAFQQTLQVLVAALKDGHGDAGYDRVTYPLPLSWAMIEDRLAVTQIATGDPSGLRPGDVILAINGRNVDDLLAEARKLASASTPQWRDIKALRLLLPHDPRPLALTAQRGNATPFTASITPKLGPGAVFPDTRTRNYSEVRPGIRYVDLSRMTETDLKAAMDDLVQARAIVLDMRGYPSAGALYLLPHLRDAVLQSDAFDIPIVTRPDRQGVVYDSKGSWRIAPVAPTLRGKLVFLTGGGAVSAAESIMGLVEREKLGTIVGEPTAGTNGNINPFTLPGDYRLTWTGMRVVKPDGTAFQGVGVSPDVLVKPTLAGIRAGRDEVLEKGIEIAMKEIAGDR